jgi:serine/threonine protein kinase
LGTRLVNKGKTTARHELPGKHFFTMSRTLFHIDEKYVPMKAIGSGAYGVVCSAIDQETEENVAIKKMTNVFDDSAIALRTLREMMILRYTLCYHCCSLYQVNSKIIVLWFMFARI